MDRQYNGQKFEGTKRETRSCKSKEDGQHNDSKEWEQKDKQWHTKHYQKLKNEQHNCIVIAFTLYHNSGNS
jgi:hypothetical protein